MLYQEHFDLLQVLLRPPEATHHNHTKLMASHGSFYGAAVVTGWSDNNY